MSNIPAMFKIVMIGDGGAGKTSISLRYTENRFVQDLKMTIGVNLFTRRVNIDGKNVTFVIWDLSGQPRFQEVVKDYFKGSHAAIAVYDITRVSTFINLGSWIERLRENAPKAVLFIVANKMDECTDDVRNIISEGQELATRHSAHFFEVSAKTGHNIQEMFYTIARTLIN